MRGVMSRWCRYCTDILKGVTGGMMMRSSGHGWTRAEAEPAAVEAAAAAVAALFLARGVVVAALLLPEKDGSSVRWL